MKKRYKWKMTQATFALVFTSIIAFAGICCFGLAEVAHLYGGDALFYLRDLPRYLWYGFSDSFLLNFVPYSIPTLVIVTMLGMVAIVNIFCFIFKLKFSNLYSFILLALGGGCTLAVLAMVMVLTRDPDSLKFITDLLLFKKVKGNFAVGIQGALLWVTAVCLVAMVFEFLTFFYYGICESLFKNPNLKGDAKYYYKHFDQEELAVLAAAPRAVAAPAQIIRQKPVLKQSPYINRITVNRGTPAPERATNVVQFVNCDETFVNDMKSKQEQAKGATFLETR